ncbi:MAG: D-tagatose-bisphosphate aldolase, class II, non-catalytic subunit [Hyphomicrobiales bacterium]|nr:MAG: D-tagatose-bisphosphate aldolase, class II, non-catalytic subunit [Hyphomicrobiales bacterium]
MTNHPLISLAKDVANGRPRAITSVCSAHPLVIEATLVAGLANDGPVLIEATCNQVNQDGGYTGMTPAVFREFVHTIAHKVNFPVDRLMLGGDHLGPNPWRTLPTEVAMAKAEAMVDAYARAGFSKLHLDTSMTCADDAGRSPPEEVIAARAARLAAVAEAATLEVGLPSPVYVIGTEVPVPGGALETLDIIEITRPEDAQRTVELHSQAFQAAGIAEAFTRCVGLVVQPGVEFGSENVVVYQLDKAAALTQVLDQLPGFVFEAHSTDYQPQAALKALVRDGCGILKVGPGLTFALRETLYGLDAIAVELGVLAPAERVSVAMEQLMLDRPADWMAHYHGTPDRQRIQRHFSYSDRIRYYWHFPQAQSAVGRLMKALEGHTIPKPLISQYLGAIYPKIASGCVEATPRSLLIAGVQHMLQGYDYAGQG